MDPFVKTTYKPQSTPSSELLEGLTDFLGLSRDAGAWVAKVCEGPGLLVTIYRTCPCLEHPNPQYRSPHPEACRVKGLRCRSCAASEILHAAGLNPILIPKLPNPEPTNPSLQTLIHPTVNHQTLNPKP